MEEKKEYRPRLTPEENDIINRFRDGSLISHNKQDRLKRYVVLGCVHVPFNNQKLTDGVFGMMEDNKFDGIVLAGDFLDMGALSSYERGRVSNTGVTLESEYNAGNDFLNRVDSLLPNDAEKYFMFGNHEERYWRWKSDIDNSKYGDFLSPERGLGLKRRGYHVYSDYKNDVLELGSLNIIHGEYFNIHCAKKHLDVFRRNILFFHTHRVQTFREGDFAAYNAGFLGDIKSKAFNYAPRGMKSAWGNGFAVVSVYGDSHFVEVINCVNDKFTYNGKMY